MPTTMPIKEATLKKQTFRMVDPAAQSVLLVGDFTDWQQRPIKMDKNGSGIWTTTVRLPMGAHNYLFIVNGEWREDPECPARTPNPYGSFNMVRQVT